MPDVENPQELRKKFLCPRCSEKKSDVRYLFLAGGHVAHKRLNLQNQKNISLSCDHCGFTEVYNLGVKLD